jgi:ATP synthase protein I
MPDSNDVPKHEVPGEAKLSASADQMVRRVNARQQRMLEARTRRDQDWYRSLALLGVVGWSVTFPTLAGVALGLWLDRVLPGRFSWTLSLLFLGLALGCYNAWSHIRDYTKG